MSFNSFLDFIADHFFKMLAVIALTFASWIFFLNHVDINEIGVAYDSRTGTISAQHPGWHVTAPWVKATTIPLIPLRVDIYSGSQRTSRFILPKLVQFNPAHLEEFIKVEGFRYFGNQGIEYVFAQYAFSNQKWNFLTELNTENTK
jgi:hypothetical protein